MGKTKHISIRKLVALLEAEGCEICEIEGWTVKFITPNALPGYVTVNPDGTYFEDIDGDQTTHKTLTALQIAWK